MWELEKKRQGKEEIENINGSEKLIRKWIKLRKTNEKRNINWEKETEFRERIKQGKNGEEWKENRKDKER